MSVLVDTSVWSLLFRRERQQLNPEELRTLQSLRDLVEGKRAKVIGPVRQELLSGIKSTLQRELLQHRFRDFEDEVLITDDYETAAEISCKCRAKGITVGSIDALLCSVAVLRSWQVFTRDGDFGLFAKAVPVQFYRE